MTNTLYRIALSTLSPREARIVGVILARVPSSRFRYVPTAQENCDIALFDPTQTEHRARLDRLRARNPNLVEIRIVDGASNGADGHCVSRRSLWSHLVSTLDEIVAGEQARRKAAKESAPPLHRSLRAATAGVNALVVDDSATVRHQLQAALQRFGVRADSAANWNAAQQALQRKSYDFMLLDVVMPGADGYEVCRHLRRDPVTRHLPVIMLTSRSSTFDRVRGALAGCDAYLVKPIELAAFELAVNRAVARLCGDDRQRGWRRSIASAMAWARAAS